MIGIFPILDMSKYLTTGTSKIYCYKYFVLSLAVIVKNENHDKWWKEIYRQANVLL